MFCPNCGKELTEGTAFCGACGEKLDNNVTGITADTGVQTASTEEKSKSIFFPKFIALIALICFFFPFMTVSCGGISYELSGKDMIFGNKEISEEVEQQTSNDDGVSLFNWFVCIAGIFGVCSLFTKRNDAIEGTKATFLSFIFLLIFRLSAKSYYKLDDMKLSEYDDTMLNISFGVALYLAMILFVIAAVLFLASAALEKMKST